MSDDPLAEFCQHTTSRYDIAALLPDDGVGIELGVAEGWFSEEMLKRSKLKYLYGVDMYEGDRGHDLDQYRRALLRLDPFRDRYSLLHMKFKQATPLFADASLDFIYVDGYAHNGEQEGKVFKQWWPKLKCGGILAGDDYDPKYPLVIEAVDQFIATNRCRLYVLHCIPGDNWASQSPTWFCVK